MSVESLEKPAHEFWERLADGPRRVLFLDYDGTLAPFRRDRHEATPYPGVREALDRIISGPGNCRVVIISGRWTRDLPPLLGLKDYPEIWGSHGLERRLPGGRYEIAHLEDDQVRGLADADDLVEAAGFKPYREQKPGCLALHWRGLDLRTQKKIHEVGKRKLAPLAASANLLFKEFDGGVELRAPARDKGDAVRTVLSEEPEDVYGAYLGDDLTDEDAFTALGDKGLGILVRDTLRPTAAKAWLRPPEELLDFLLRWADICEHGRNAD